MAERPETYLDRYTTGARLNHWANALILIALALSGLSLFHPSMYFLTDLFGGGVWTRILHPWLGVAVMITFAGLFIRFVRFNLWNRDDSAWMANVHHVVAGREESVPESGKYNAGQKLVFWLMSVLVLVLFLTGLVMWDSYFADATTIDQKRLAAVLHALTATLMIMVVIVHIYAAIWIRGTVRGMTTGSVTGGWAWRHHRKWLRQELAKNK